MKVVACECCHGSGKVIDRKAAAEELRARRIRLRLPATDVAKRMGVGRAYIGQIELGARSISEKRIHEYERILDDYRSELAKLISEQNQ